MCLTTFSEYRLTDPRQFAILLARVTDVFGMAGARTPWWAYTWPLLAWAVLLMTPFVKGGLIDAVAGVALVTTVFAAVYHAEVVALRTGLHHWRASGKGRSGATQCSPRL